MTSIAEQFVSQVSWQSFSRAKDLHKKIGFTLVALLVYRFGTYIPMPGIDPNAMKALAQNHGGRGFVSMFNMISGGALERMGVFALNLMPYISSSIIIQLLSAVSPYLASLKKEGEVGKHKLTQYTRYGTIALACIQGGSLISYLSMSPGVVYEPGPFFYVSALATVVGSTLFLMWLGEQITSRGIGSGSSMIIYAGIMANLPHTIIQSLVKARVDSAFFLVVAAILAAVALISFIIFMERAYRKVVIEYPQSRTGNVAYGSEKSYIPLKLNASGVLPSIFATSIIGFMKMIGQAPWLDFSSHITNGTVRSIFKGIAHVFALLLSDQNSLGILFQMTIIVLFCFFYTSIVFNTEETADNLRKSGAFIPGCRPGSMTKQYLETILERITVLGAAYIAFVATFPAVLNLLFGMDFPFQGTSILISVSITIEIISHIHSYVISHQYQPILSSRSVRRKKRG